MNLSEFNPAATDYSHLSLRDLLDAREQYHVFLMQHPNVVATAIGRYRIRSKDSWPTQHGPGDTHGKYARTLANSEVRPYSWPAVLVFVSEWVDGTAADAEQGTLVPRTLYLGDGRRVPVCVIEAPRESTTDIAAREIRFPVNNLGPGSPIVARVQGREYVATVGALVSDGHKVFALTNRHVTGDPGEVVYAQLNGSQVCIGTSSSKQLTRTEFGAVYPGWPGGGVYVNRDIGLIELDDLDRWTTKARGLGQLGRMIDISVHTVSLGLVGCHVRGVGAASGEMAGEIQALFYRYKTGGGFEYVADVLIGPRPPAGRKTDEAPFITLPGDSGTLWTLEPVPGTDKKTASDEPKEPPAFLPLAVQWGRNMLRSGAATRPQGYVLATFLARVCAELDVDPIRDWNVDQPDTWGALGHFAIAAKSQVALSGDLKKLTKLMKANAAIISHSDDVILEGDFKGMGEADFVALADVPDFFWKPRIAKQGHGRALEGPNHFADMDQPDDDGNTLLSLCEDPANIDADRWDAFYESVRDLLKDNAIAAQHRGLLPFRVWQIFDTMVGFAGDGDAARFVCAAGVLTHYTGDACQPLHISYLHDGDPLRKYTYTFQKGKKAGQTEERPLGMGVHSGYEDEMVFAYREEIVKGLGKTPTVAAADRIKTGFEAAQRTIAMMRATFDAIPPKTIVNAFVAYKGARKDRAAYMWKKFGKKTIKVMQGGSQLTALLWESAWAQGGGEANVTALGALTEKKAMAICGDPDFLPSLSIDKIGAILKK